MLCQYVLYRDTGHLKEHVYSQFPDLKIVLPTTEGIEQLNRSAIRT